MKKPQQFRCHFLAILVLKEERQLLTDAGNDGTMFGFVHRAISPASQDLLGALLNDALGERSDPNGLSDL